MGFYHSELYSESELSGNVLKRETLEVDLDDSQRLANQKEPSPDTKSAIIVLLYFPASRIMRDKFLL